MSQVPKISIVVPSFNQARYLDATLASIVQQRYPETEIIVMDGGSDDGSVDIIKSYESEITYWQSQKDGGQASAINMGMKKASGDILCWLNSDDFFMPGVFKKISARFTQHNGECFILYGCGIVMNEECAAAPQASAYVPGEVDAGKLSYCDPLLQPSTFWSRGVWGKVGELDAKLNYTLDWEWFQRAFSVADSEYSSDLFSVYRHHDQHKTGTGGEARRAEIVRLVKERSNEYWAHLYELVNANFDAIVHAEEVMRNAHIPLRLGMGIRFPAMWKIAKSHKDIFAILNMLR